MNTANRPLRVFLCHSSNDKPAVHELYQKLGAEAWIEPWLAEEKLYPGEDWDLMIQKAVEESDVVLVCLSNNSITKRGYVQKELRYVVDIALEIPEEEIFIIPLRLEECIPPRSLRAWQYADYFPEINRERSFQRLLVSLKKRADSIGLQFDLEQEPSEKAKLAQNYYQIRSTAKKDDQKPVIEMPKLKKATSQHNRLTLTNGMELMCVPAGNFLMGSEKYDNTKPQHTVDIPYDYWMTRFLVSNELYFACAKAKGIKHPVNGWEKKKDHPVVSVNWNNVIEYCLWLNNLFKAEMPSGLILRLPTEAEWEKAARGTDGREYPWGNTFDKNKCNTSTGGKNDTTSVGLYSPQGDSLYGCADMVGNVWEWTHSLKKEYPYKVNDGREDEKASGARVLRGGSFLNQWDARCTSRYDLDTLSVNNIIGFRVVASLNLS